MLPLHEIFEIVLRITLFECLAGINYLQEILKHILFSQNILGNMPQSQCFYSVLNVWKMDRKLGRNFREIVKIYSGVHIILE